MQLIELKSFEQITVKELCDKAAGHDLSAEPELLTELIIGGLEQAVRWWFTDANPLSLEVLKKQMLDSILRLISEKMKKEG